MRTVTCWKLSIRTDAICQTLCLSPPLRLTKLHVTRSLSLACAITVLTRVVLFSHVLLFVILPLDSVVELKCKSKSDDEEKKSCKVMTLEDKIKIVESCMMVW
jgi:hypothetical protein